MVICAEFSNLEFSNIFSILSYSDIFIIFLFSHFLSFSLLDLYKIKLNYVIILSTAIFCQIDLCRHTNRLWLPLFFLDLSLWENKEIVLDFLLCYGINIGEHTMRSCLPYFFLSVSIFILRRSLHIVTCWHTWLACLPFYNVSGGMISPAIFFFLSDIFVLSAH